MCAFARATDSPSVPIQPYTARDYTRRESKKECDRVLAIVSSFLVTAFILAQAFFHSFRENDRDAVIFDACLLRETVSKL